MQNGARTTAPHKLIVSSQFIELPRIRRRAHQSFQEDNEMQ